MADADAITPDTAAAAASKTSKTLDGVEDDDDASNSSVDSPRMLEVFPNVQSFKLSKQAECRSLQYLLPR